MNYNYSRRTKVEEKKNIRKAYFFVILSFGLIVLFFFFGLPTIVKFAAFLTEIKSSSSPIGSSDTTPPQPPRFGTLPEYTKETKVEVSGNTEAGSIVKISANNKDEEVVANNEGRFNYTFILRDGENGISAKSVDQAGNESSDSEFYTIIFDKDPPDLQITKPSDGGQFYGSSEKQITIEGITEENTSVNINGRIVIVGSSGKFSLMTTLTDGENTFTAKAQDKAGNLTEVVFKVTYHP